MAFFDADRPEHLAVAQALAKGLGYAPYGQLNNHTRKFVVRLSEAVLAALVPMSWLSTGHRRLDTCPGCGEAGLSTTALTGLAYEFVTCDCGTPTYPHLVEQMWHRAHIGAPGEQIAATVRRDTLHEVWALLGRAARNGEAGAAGQAHLTYAGGLRAAHRLVRELVAKVSAGGRP